MAKILITPRSLTQKGHPELEKLKKAGYEVIYSTPGVQPSEEELLKLLPDCVGMLAGVEKISEKVLESAKNLKAISRNGTGVDSIDLKAAERLKIKILRAEGANAQGVAELATGLMLAMIRAIPYHSDWLKNGEWKRKKGIEIIGRTLGIVGCGKVGRIITKGVLGMGMKVIAYDVFIDKSFSPSNDFKYASLDEVIKTSDVISLHCPMPEDGKPLITKEVISKMKKGAYLINTARSGLINNDDVLEALISGQIAGYATDVYNEEPPVLNDLFRHENVILTPHIGGFTEESIENATRIAVENLLKELK
ncbi:MAG: phosphoglycerate dehydrogenase [Spirochaetes bacterium]|nr:phosphoglycerate dehydrogenase [Spirochaetota bacterium]